MFYPAQDVLRACRAGLSDQRKQQRAAIALLGRQPIIPDAIDLLVHFLRSIPNAKDQRKILNRFQKITAEHGSTIRDLAWWDINPPERILTGTVTRDGVDIFACFMWK
jgi:hypothetical protein